MRGEEQPAGDASPVGRAVRAPGHVSSGAVPWQQMAEALEAAARDLYIAMRTLAASLPVEPQPGIPAAVPGQIRQAANAAGTAWQCLASGHPAGTATTVPGPARALRDAVRRAVAAWSPPVTTAPGLDEITALAMDTAHAMAAAAGYLAWEATGSPACRLHDAQDSLEAAGEHLRQALTCSRAASVARRDAAPITRPGGGVHGWGEDGVRAAGPRHPVPEQAASPPCQFPASGIFRDTRPEMQRRKPVAYAIGGLLACCLWRHKRSGKRQSTRIGGLPGDERVIRGNGTRALAEPGLPDSRADGAVHAGVIRDAVITIAAAGVAAVTLSGCGGPASVPPSAHGTPLRTPAAAPPVPGTRPARTLVVAAYTAYFPVLARAEAVSPARAKVMLALYAAQPYLGTVLAQMASYRARGEAASGYVTPHPIRVTVSGHLATVYDCQDASHATLTNTRTGKVTPPLKGSARTYLIASLALGKDGRWRITSLAHVATPCSPASAPSS